MIWAIVGLVALLVLLALGVMGLSLVACFLMWGRATQAARYDLDAAAQALKMQEIIDKRVQDRVGVVRVASAPAPRSNQVESKYPEQPMPPGIVRATVDDVHEIERETNRLIGEQEWSTRDNFTQPLSATDEV